MVFCVWYSDLNTVRMFREHERSIGNNCMKQRKLCHFLFEDIRHVTFSQNWPMSVCKRSERTLKMTKYVWYSHQAWLWLIDVRILSKLFYKYICSGQESNNMFVFFLAGEFTKCNTCAINPWGELSLELFALLVQSFVNMNQLCRKKQRKCFCSHFINQISNNYDYDFFQDQI